MRLPFLRPKSGVGDAEKPAASGAETSALQLARTQARRRLIGALVLLVAAVVGFPLLFETQPRPLPGAIPIDNGPLVLREGVAPMPKGPAPGAQSPAPDRSAAERVAQAAPLPAVAAPPTTPAPTASSPGAAAAKVASVASVPAAVDALPKTEASDKSNKTDKTEKPANPVKGDKATPAAAAPSAVQIAVPAAAPTAATPSATQTPGAPVAEAAERWVVQVGAYNDMERMRGARQKAEKLGFKTYITEVDTSTGRRTRVRLGPFASKKEAEAAAVKVKAAGMDANVLSL